MPLFTIAKITLFETARRRLVLIAAILTAIIIALSGWGFSRLNSITDHGVPVDPSNIKLIAAALVLVVAYMFSFILAIGSAFLAAPSIATDVESGLVLSILPRPIRRADFVIGKWLGLTVLMSVYAAGAGALELIVVQVTTGYVPSHPFFALLFLVAQSVSLLTLALLASTRMAPIAGGIIAVALYGIAWICGIAGVLGTVLNNAALTGTGAISSLLLPTDGLWRGALFSLQPAILTAGTMAEGPVARVSNPFSVVSGPTTAYIIWSIVWIAGMVGLTVLSFSKRDL